MKENLCCWLWTCFTPFSNLSFKQIILIINSFLTAIMSHSLFYDFTHFLLYFLKKICHGFDSKIVNRFCKTFTDYWSSHPEVFCRKDVLRSFAKFTGKHLCQSLFLIKWQASACSFIKKETLAQTLSRELCEISKNTFSYITPSVAASADYWKTSDAHSVGCRINR